MRTRSRVVVAVLATTAAGTLLTAGLLTVRPQASPSRQEATNAPTTLTVRGDLEQRETVSGTLGYGVATQITGRRAGTITWLPAPGRVISRGKALWRVDDAPVSLFIGALPLWRTLQAGHTPQTGRDVDLVASNLRHLGFWHGETRDARFDRYLSAAVAAWQRSLGVTPSGVLHTGDVVVSPSAVRVGEVQAHVADSADQAILTVTARDRTVVLKVPADLAASLHAGAGVPVTLPSGARVDARMVRVAGTTTGGDGGSTPTVSVVVAATSQTPLDRSVLGSVTATIVTRSARDVVSVPVGALLALSGGGYALERPDHRLFRVETGLIADGRVAVTGVGAGVRVLVAS